MAGTSPERATSGSRDGGPIFILLFVVTLSAAAADRLAVLYFDAEGVGRDLEPLGRAVAELLSTELGAAEELQVVTRGERFEARAALGAPLASAADPGSARALGERLRASWLVTGTLTVMFDGMRIDARVVDVATGEVRGATGVTGPPEDFVRLQHAVALDLLAALGLTSRYDWPGGGSLERAVAIGREIDELEAAYRGRLDSIETYLDQRWQRLPIKVDHIGRDNQIETWALFDGQGDSIAAADAAARVGDADRLARMERHRRRGRAIAATSLAFGVATCAGTAAWSATSPGLDDVVADTPEYRRRQARRYAWFVGCAVGPAVALNGFGIGSKMQQKPRYPGNYWSPGEADAMVDQVNAQLAEDLGLTPADVDEATRRE